ncbi:MAG TPA: hypothetical protein VF981_04880 [Gemmatimonadaceae bacterium]
MLTSLRERSIHRHLLIRFPLFLLAASLVAASDAGAQIDRIRRTAQRAAERELDRKVEGAVRCAMGNTGCVEDARKAGKPVVITDAKGEVGREGE